MRKRTLFGIVALVFAVPALASDLPRAKAVNPESLVAIADLQVEGAFDDLATPGTRNELLDAARKNYEAALQQQPANKDALRGLARLHARAGNLHKATEANRNYLRFYPNDPQAADGRTECQRYSATTRAATGAVEDAPSVCFELRILKLPAAFYCDLNVKLPENGLLAAEEAKKLLDAAQLCRRASVMQCPKITAASGQVVPLSVRDERTFVTGVEATKVKGATVLVPQSKRVALGTAASVVGRIAPDGKSVGVQMMVGRTWLAGEPELVPLATKITPVFEGGSVGTPVPFTQSIQAPDVRTANVAKGANVPSGATLVVGTWAETQEEKTGKKAKPETVEYTCVALATVRVLPAEPAAAEPGLQRQIIDLLTKLDTAPALVTVSATVVQVPREFVSRCGLNAGGPADAKSWTLSAREAKMLAELLRAAKGRGECKVLSEPTICVADGQAGVVQVGQRIEAPLAAGAAQRVSFEELPVSLALELTPRLSPDSGSVLLATNLQLAGERGAAIRSQGLRAAAKLRLGETLVLASAAEGKAPVTLVILTPSLK